MPHHPCQQHPALVRHLPELQRRGLCPRRVGPAKQWQTVGSNLQPPVIVGIGHSKIQISDELVCGHPSPGLSADPPSGAFQSEPSSPEHPTPRARCTVVAKGVEWTATLAGTVGKGQREGKTPLKQHPEQSGALSVSTVKRGLRTRTLLPPAHSETATKRGRDQTCGSALSFFGTRVQLCWMFRVANQLSGTQVQTPRAPEVADGDQLPMLSIAGPQTLPLLQDLALPGSPPRGKETPCRSPLHSLSLLPPWGACL